MKTKNIYIYVFLIIATLTMTSCDDELAEINENPNVATSIDPDYLFGYATLAWSGSRTGGDTFIPLGFANQSIATGGNFGWGYAEDRYDVSPFSIGNTWRFYFVNGGNNLSLAITEAEAAVPANNNAAAQCKIILANTMFEATMIYGDIPYTEAWNSDITSPVFDSQEDVLNNLLVLLDEAIDQINLTSSLKIDTNDAYFGGDLAQWLKYAKSLKLKILMTMIDKDSTKSTDIANLLNENLIDAASDNVEMPFFDETNAENPKNKVFKNYAGGVNPWMFANNNVFSYMDERNDPRIPIYFDSNKDDGTFEGVDTATEATEDSSTISLDNLWKVDAPDLILSYQEVLLYKAEIYARGIGVATNLTTANTYYQAGVKAALLYYGVNEADTDDYVTNTLTDISTLSQVEAVEEIQIQQWIDLMDRTLEGFIHTRRTNVPTLTLPPGAPAGGLFARYTYPDSETSTNINAPSPIPFLDDKLWFHDL